MHRSEPVSEHGLGRLQVWVRAKDYALEIYRQVLPHLPAAEKWNPDQQLRRSCLSVAANIAEGHGRFYYQDNVRFCYNARGSLEETRSHVLFAFEAGYIPETLYRELEREGEEIHRMLNGYIAYLKTSKRGVDEPGSELSVRERPASYPDEPEDHFPDRDSSSRNSVSS